MSNDSKHVYNQIEIRSFKQHSYASINPKEHTAMEHMPEINWARWKVSAADGAESSNRDSPIVNIATLDKSESSKEVYEFLQVGEYEELIRSPRAETMIAVYDRRESKGTSYCTWSALVPLKKIPSLIEDPHWHQPDFTPWAEMGPDGKNVFYDKWNADGKEPLVLERYFYRIKEGYLEIAEDFRLFHNLYNDKDRGEFIKISASGEEEVVVKEMSTGLVSIRCRELKEFLTIKNMALCVFFAHDRKSYTSIDDLGITSGRTEILSSDDHVLCVKISGEIRDWRNETKYWNSRFIGKKIYFPYNDPSKTNFGNFRRINEDYETFIIRTDENDEQIIHSCDPEKLDKFANVGFLTPISFKREVLDKYREDPKYEISAGHVRCGDLWHLTIDTGNPEKVCVFLGDLGEQLHYPEQQHWRHYNIASSGGMSEWFFKWQHGNLVEDTPSPEFLFIDKYKETKQKWKKALGWEIFKDLSMEDAHALSTISIPNSQNDMDIMILTITKCLCDSINTGATELSKHINSKEKKSGRLGSITVLDRYLVSKNVMRSRFINKWMKNIQAVRSAGSAHIKEADYAEKLSEFKMGSENLKETAMNILISGIAILDALEKSISEILQYSNEDSMSSIVEKIGTNITPSSYRIIEAEPQKNQHMFIKFADGSEGVVDMAEVFGEDAVFADLKNPGKFADFQIKNHTIQWGPERDICNHWLYQLVTGTTDTDIYGSAAEGELRRHA